MVFPERFVIALLKDAERHAREHQIEFRILTYHTARREGGRIVISATSGRHADSRQPVLDLQPSSIINATGAWGDLTLEQLEIESPRLFGGTKGSHIIVRHEGLRSALGNDGIYAETADGRLVFLLPFDDAVLIGTTDLRFQGSPGAVTASPEEIQYLVETANLIFSEVNLSTADVAAHYCGVRPLPWQPEGTTGAIPRGHSVQTLNVEGVPLHTLIGGKLTTCRAFGEEVADRVLSDTGRTRVAQTRDRVLSGGENYPADPGQWIQKVASETGHPVETVAFLFRRMGTAMRSLLQRLPPSPNLPMLPISAAVANEIARTEWVSTLADLVERRLMLVFTASVSAASLAALSECTQLPATDPSESPRGLAAYQEFLHARYGIRP
jgi:glycerol-3-phosphate dehydrogenase